MKNFRLPVLGSFFLLSLFLAVGTEGVSAATPTPGGRNFNQVKAGCDLCGWCGEDKNNKPATWERCMKCIFPVRWQEADIQGLINSSGVFTGPTKPVVDKDNPYYPSQPEIPGFDINNPDAPAGSSKSWTVFGCMDTSPGGYVSQLYRIMLAIGGGLAFLALLYGGLLVVTAGGNPLQVSRGKSIMLGAIFGILLVFFSVFLLRLIGLEILKIPGFG